MIFKLKIHSYTISDSIAKDATVAAIARQYNINKC